MLQAIPKVGITSEMVEISSNDVHQRRTFNPVPARRSGEVRDRPHSHKSRRCGDPTRRLGTDLTCKDNTSRCCDDHPSCEEAPEAVRRGGMAMAHAGDTPMQKSGREVEELGRGSK